MPWRITSFRSIVRVFTVYGCLIGHSAECPAKGDAWVELNAWKAEQAAQDAGLGITAGEDEQPVATAHLECEAGSCEASGQVAERAEIEDPGKHRWLVEVDDELLPVSDETPGTAVEINLHVAGDV